MFRLKKKQQKRQAVFIISAPRSGSTWLQTALNSHPEVFCTEHRFFGNFFEVWPNDDGTSSSRITLDKYVDLLGSYYRWDALGISQQEFKNELMAELATFFHDFGKAYSKKRITVDKVTPYLGTARIVAESINKYFANSKVVFLIRDGRDVLTSGVFDWMARSDHGTDRFKFFVERDPRVRLGRFFNESDIRTWCGYWKEAFETMERFKGKPHVLRFEEMKANQARALRALFDYLAVDNRDNVIDRCVTASTFSKMSAGRKPGQMDPTAKVRKGVVGDWANYFTKKDGLEFLRFSEDSLIKWGYESNDQWLGKLPQKLHLSLQDASQDSECGNSVGRREEIG